MVWALADRLGSIDTVTDGSGNVVDKRTFDSFGKLLTQTNPSVSFRYGYTGRELDSETGLNYYRARYYDSNVGRFISVDPIGFGGDDTNLYRYVGNSSTNYTDPSGLAALPSFDDVRQGLNNFGRSWDTATNFWSRELVAPTATSLSRATQNGVNFYTDLVASGQQRGGVLGALEQGAGYIGGTLASVPGAIAESVDNCVKANPVLATKLGGAVRAGAGVFEIAGGLATTQFGVGVPIVVKGINDYQTGLRQLYTGQQTDSLIYGAVKNLTGSSNLAGTVDAGTEFGAGWMASNSLKAAKSGITRGVLGENAGGGVAAKVLPGGNGQSISGHGVFEFGSGTTIVPEGGRLILPRHGIKISDTTGKVLESIDLEALANTTSKKAFNKLIRNQLKELGFTTLSQHLRVFEDLEGLRIIEAGSSVENYAIYPPGPIKPINIFENSTTVNEKTLLSDILKKDMGTCSLGTCTEIKY